LFLFQEWEAVPVGIVLGRVYSEFLMFSNRFCLSKTLIFRLKIPKKGKIACVGPVCVSNKCSLQKWISGRKLVLGTLHLPHACLKGFYVRSAPVRSIGECCDPVSKRHLLLIKLTLH